MTHDTSTAGNEPSTKTCIFVKMDQHSFLIYFPSVADNKVKIIYTEVAVIAQWIACIDPLTS